MDENALTEKELGKWLGRTREHEDTLHPVAATALAATLNREKKQFTEGQPLPLLWHWLYFLETTRLKDLADDGHPIRGQFLPPIPLPRRMWAGSRLSFHHPLHLGEPVSKKSTIKSLQFKQGRSGELAFLCVVHETSNEAGIAITEEQDLVYRGPLSSSAAPKALMKEAEMKAAEVPDYSFTLTPDPVLLFRYSALTFNAHRIHYDRDYGTSREGYPGLVVHGPLLATLMMELVTQEYLDRPVLSFEFRAVQPVFDGAKVVIGGKVPDDSGRCLVWAANSDGEVCMTGGVVLGA